MSQDINQLKTPEEVLQTLAALQKQHENRAVLIARLKMWAQVGLQGLTPNEVRAFSKRGSDMKDSYERWLKTQRKLTSNVMQMGRSTFGMKGSTTKEDPDWVRYVSKDRYGRYDGNVYTVAILNNGEEVRLDPPIVAPLD